MKVKQIPKTDCKVKAIIRRFTVDQTTGLVYLDVSCLLPDVHGNPQLYFKGKPRLVFDETPGDMKAKLVCTKGFRDAIVNGQKRPDHVACLLSGRFTEYGMMMFCDDLFRYWQRYLEDKNRRREAAKKIELSKLMNGGKTDAQLHR